MCGWKFQVPGNQLPFRRRHFSLVDLGKPTVWALFQVGVPVIIFVIWQTLVNNEYVCRDFSFDRNILRTVITFDIDCYLCCMLYPTMHLSRIQKYTTLKQWNINAHVSVLMWCIVGYVTDALWYLRDWSIIFLFYHPNGPIPQIPECICSISHNAPFRTEICWGNILLSP